MQSWVAPAAVDAAFARLGYEWSAETRKSVLVWLFENEQLHRLLRLAHFSLGLATATAEDAEDAWAAFCAGAVNDEAWNETTRTRVPPSDREDDLGEPAVSAAAGGHGRSEIDDKMLRFQPGRGSFWSYLQLCFGRFCYRRGKEIRAHLAEPLPWTDGDRDGGVPAPGGRNPGNQQPARLEQLELREALRACLAALPLIDQRVSGAAPLRAWAQQQGNRRDCRM
jgi:hypothetical protein